MLSAACCPGTEGFEVVGEENLPESPTRIFVRSCFLQTTALTRMTIKCTVEGGAHFKIGKNSPTVRLSWEFKTWQLLSAHHRQCLPPVGFSEGGSGLDHGLPGSSARAEPGEVKLSLSCRD